MTAAVHDPYAQPMPGITPTWTAPGSGHGTIAANGTYTAPFADGTFTIQATYDGLSGSVQMTVAGSYTALSGWTDTAIGNPTEGEDYDAYVPLPSNVTFDSNGQNIGGTSDQFYFMNMPQSDLPNLPKSLLQS
jgi:hypothetical protein